MSIKQDIHICLDLIEKANSTVVLSGAGLSTASGIPDFRGPNGIYSGKKGLNMEEVFEINFFMKKPAIFYDFYRDFLSLVGKARPTYTHRFLAALEREGLLSAVVTQNIDALHQMGGTKSVYEIHGSIWTSHCLQCGYEYDYHTSQERVLAQEIPLCDCGGLLKPDIVFFGENVKYLDECTLMAEKADLFFVLGSSLTVAPASYLPSRCSGTVVIVNRGEVHFYHGPGRPRTIMMDYDLDTFFSALNEDLGLSIR